MVRDDAGVDTRTLRPKLYHLFREPAVSEDLNRRGAEPHEPLPKLVQDADTLLGADWRGSASSGMTAAKGTSGPSAISARDHLARS